QLGQCALEIGPCLGSRRTDTGDDLDRRLEELVLGLGVHATRIGRPGIGENLGGAAVQLASVDVDDLELHLDAETGTLGGVEVDLHQFSPAGSLVPGGAPTVCLQVHLGVVTNPAWCPFVTTKSWVLSDVRLAARPNV